MRPASDVRRWDRPRDPPGANVPFVLVFAFLVFVSAVLGYAAIGMGTGGTSLPQDESDGGDRYLATLLSSQATTEAQGWQFLMATETPVPSPTVRPTIAVWPTMTPVAYCGSQTRAGEVCKPMPTPYVAPTPMPYPWCGPGVTTICRMPGIEVLPTTTPTLEPQ